MFSKFICSIIFIYLSIFKPACSNKSTLRSNEICIRSNECHGKLAHDCGDKICSTDAKKCQSFRELKKMMLLNRM